MYYIDPDSCFLCCVCKDSCPADAIVVALTGSESTVTVKNVFINQDDCIECGLCEEICPAYAVFSDDDDSGGGGTSGDDPGDWGEDPEDGGGGTTQPSATARDYVSNTNDKLCKDNITSSMSTQILNTCVISIMEYIERELCGSNDVDYYLDYAQTYGQWVVEEGVGLDEIYTFVNKHFNTVAFTNFSTAIDNGWIVMTDIPSDIANSTHNVAVVGYRSDGTLIYMDPMEGKLKEWNVSNFNKNYAIPISGCK